MDRWLKVKSQPWQNPAWVQSSGRIVHSLCLNFVCWKTWTQFRLKLLKYQLFSVQYQILFVLWNNQFWFIEKKFSTMIPFVFGFITEDEKKEIVLPGDRFGFQDLCNQKFSTQKFQNLNVLLDSLTLFNSRMATKLIFQTKTSSSVLVKLS